MIQRNNRNILDSLNTSSEREREKERERERTLFLTVVWFISVTTFLYLEVQNSCSPSRATNLPFHWRVFDVIANQIEQKGIACFNSKSQAL